MQQIHWAQLFYSALKYSVIIKKKKKTVQSLPKVYASYIQDKIVIILLIRHFLDFFLQLVQYVSGFLPKVKSPNVWSTEQIILFSVMF